MHMVPKHSRCSSSLRTGETQVRDAVRRRVYSWRHRDYGLAGPQQRLSEVLSFRFLWRRWQRPPRICTHVLKHGVTRGLPRVCVCVCEHTLVCHAWLRRCPCVCALVCITAQCAACLGPAQRVALAEDASAGREPGFGRRHRRKVFAFWEGPGGGTLPSRPQERNTAQETHEENSESQAAHQALCCSLGPVACRGISQSGTATLGFGLWFAWPCPGRRWRTALRRGPLRHQGRSGGAVGPGGPTCCLCPRSLTVDTGPRGHLGDSVGPSACCTES